MLFNKDGMETEAQRGLVTCPCLHGSKQLSQAVCLSPKLLGFSLCWADLKQETCKHEKSGVNF